MHSFISFVIMHKRKIENERNIWSRFSREFSLGFGAERQSTKRGALAGAKDHNHIRNWVHYESIWWRHLPFIRTAEHANNHLSESLFPHSTINHSDEMVFEHELWTLTRFLLFSSCSHIDNNSAERAPESFFLLLCCYFLLATAKLASVMDFLGCRHEAPRNPFVPADVHAGRILGNTRARARTSSSRDKVFLACSI